MSRLLLIDRIRHSAGVEFAQLVRRKFAEVRIAQIAGSLTYTTLLSLVPLLTVILTVMSQFSQFAKLGAGMRSFLLDNLLPDRAGKVIATYAIQFSQKASDLTIVGTGLLLITAVMLLQTVDRCFNSIWGIRRPRPWWMRMPLYWVAITLGPILFAATVAATGKIITASLGLVRDQPEWLAQMLYRLSPALLLSLFFAYLFHAVPNRRLTLWHSVAGGLLAGVGVVLIQRLFGFYLSKLPNFTLIYGTFSVLPIFLIWLYLSWFAILLGAVVAAVLPDFFERRRLLPDTTAGRIHAALRLTLALIEAQRQGKTLALNTLAQQSGQSLLRADQMLEDMFQAGWVVRTDNDEWVVTVAADAISLGDLVAQVVAGNQPRKRGMAEGGEQRIIDVAFSHVRQALNVPVSELGKKVAQSG